MRGSPIKTVLSVALAASMAGGTASSQNPPEPPGPTLERGIAEYNLGDLAAAVFTLESVIRALAVEPAVHARELSQAYLYRGAAFVGLGQEENAKGSFAAALNYDKTLHPRADQFSPRVVRVFEAARQGKSKSVLLPPSGVAKKAGIGTLGIIGIVAAGVAIGGGAAAVASHGPDTTVATTTTTTTMPGGPGPKPSPTPTPAARTLTLTLAGCTLGGCSVVVNPGGNTCPAGNHCLFTYPSGTQVQLQPHVTNVLELFTPGWSGDCGGQGSMCTLVMDQDHSAGAQWTP